MAELKNIQNDQNESVLPEAVRQELEIMTDTQRAAVIMLLLGE